MIKLVPDPTFDSVVQVSVPGRDEPSEARFEFRALSRKRLASLLVLTRLVSRNPLARFIEYLKLCWRTRKRASVVDMLDEIIVKWDGISEPYSRDNLRTLLLEYPGTHINIYFAYLQGLREAKRKN